MKSHDFGKQGEDFAEEFLRQHGYRILVRNYRVKRGEIDLIADDQGMIVFVEVKTRKANDWNAFEAVGPVKQRRMIHAATQYLVETFGREDIHSRFDVLAVLLGDNGEFKGDLIKEAFSIF
ncbi:MAG: YraN family protein [Candidatus Omnitrophica bacterium]|nr:YraN family protein [Candidatus Omnitrophota bacterium]